MKSITSVIAFLLIGALVTLLFSCPNPIGDILAKQIADADVPNIAISSPTDGGVYGGTIVIEGSVADAGGDVKSLEVAVPVAEIKETVELDEEGGFSFEFSTKNPDGTRVLDGPATIEITAEDWNGNSTTESITIVKSATGDFSSVTVKPSNKQVSITWEPVLHAESYTLFESKYGQTRENVTSPYIWDELENGEIYRFQVKAEIPDSTWEDAYSSTIEKMPLSVRSFAPWIRETGYKSITIEWRDNPNVEEYTVELSVDPDGTWEVRRNLTANFFRDDQVDHDTEYFYRVTPAGYDDVTSEYHRCVAGRFTSNKTAETYTTRGYARDVAVAGSYAYVADTLAELTVVDISDPADPVLGNSVAPGEMARAVAVSGSYAYVADEWEGLTVVNVAYPDNPFFVTTVPTGGNVATGVAVSGDYAYVADGWAGFTVVDISTPSEPSVITTVSTSDFARGVAVSGNTACVADSDAGLTLVNITNPRIPLVDTTPIATSDYAMGVAADGPYAYVADDHDGLTVVDISMKTVEISCGLSERSYDVAVSGTYAYVAHSSGGCTVFDISSPTVPSEEYTVAVGESARGVAVGGPYLYIADYGAGLSVVDISTPENPAKRAPIATNDDAEAVAVAGSYAFVADGFAGVTVIDISDPENPAFVKTVAARGDYTSGILVRGDYAYLADGSAGLTVMDISTPVDPSLVGTSLYTGSAEQLAAAGTYAYVVDTYGGMTIVDINDPLDLQLVGTEVNTGSAGRDEAVSGTYAYVADKNAGLVIVDIYDPANPSILDPLPSADDAHGITVAGASAFVADYSAGLTIVDLWEEPQ